MPHIISQREKRRIDVIYIRAFFLILQNMFAVLGVYFVLSFWLDRICEKRANARCFILLDEVDKVDTEYLVRFLESRFACGEFSKLFSGILISKTSCVDSEKLKSLCEEYQNIRFL